MRGTLLILALVSLGCNAATYDDPVRLPADARDGTRVERRVVAGDYFTIVRPHDGPPRPFGYVDFPALAGDRLGFEIRGGSVHATMQGESRDLGPMPADAACVAWAGGGRERAEARWAARPRVRVASGREDVAVGLLSSLVAGALDPDDDEDETVGEATARESERRRRRR